MSPDPMNAGAPDADSVRAQLKTILSSKPFQGRSRDGKRKRAARILEFLVEETLAGRADDITEYTIGVKALDKSKDFEPLESNIVRVEIGRMRKTLTEYYVSEEASDELLIEVITGTHVPTFSWRTEVPATTPQPEPLRPWNIPPRNPFFTGRGGYLEQLRAAFVKSSQAAITQAHAISGLGGIGKTHAAIEYAYRYRDHYSAGLWVNAESWVSLLNGYVRLAQSDILDLPQRTEADANIVAASVRRWLESHGGWLLILDNVDDMAVISTLLPTAGVGHCLITTRLPTIGRFGNSLELSNFDTSEGVRFLLRRARLIAHAAPSEMASPEEQSLAEEITGELMGLPLALDQAGAYVDETPSTLAEYLSLYRTQGARLLRAAAGFSTEHPSVATTFTLAFEKACNRNPIAGDLLRAVAFMAPDAIPEEIFTAGATHLGDELGQLLNREPLFNEVVGVKVAPKV